VATELNPRYDFASASTPPPGRIPGTVWRQNDLYAFPALSRGECTRVRVYFIYGLAIQRTMKTGNTVGAAQPHGITAPLMVRGERGSGGGQVSVARGYTRGGGRRCSTFEASEIKAAKKLARRLSPLCGSPRAPTISLLACACFNAARHTRYARMPLIIFLRVGHSSVINVKTVIF